MTGSPVTKRGYRDPMASVTAADTRRATKSSVMAGRYMRRTVLILPEMDETINAISEETGVKRMELVRWLLAVSIESYKNGRRPETTEVVSTKVAMPDWQLGE